jgi:hypothetical protein
MSRRNVAYLALAIASFVVAACAQPVAPQHDDTLYCPNGIVIVGSGGLHCPP